MVAIQHEDGGPWMHSTVEEVNNPDHQGQSYSVTRVMKTGRLIMLNMRHIYSTPSTTEQYLWEGIKKGTG